MYSDQWCLLVLNLPGQSGAIRMRVWRALKAAGAGMLRDGVYVLPYSEAFRSTLQAQAEAVENAGGNAFLLDYSGHDEDLAIQFRALFDRSTDYAEWLARTGQLLDDIENLDEPEARRRESQLRREFSALCRIDFFAGAEKLRAEQGLADMAAAVNAHFSADEPVAGNGIISQREPNQFRCRQWATRKNLWVDRVASAWLIARFIDPGAEFIWLNQPADCPPEAVGFDFDDAEFTHIENLVTFEVLLHSFGLDSDSALTRLGTLVHFLDVGGRPVADADGFLTMLAGIKHQSETDDDMLASAGSLLDAFYSAYTHRGGKVSPA